MTAIRGDLRGWLRSHASLADSGIWALVIGGLLVQDRDSPASLTAFFVAVAVQVIARDLGERRAQLGAVLSVVGLLPFLARGDGPTVVVGYVVVALADTFRHDSSWRDKRVSFAVMLAGCAAVTYVPWLARWPTSAIFSGPARSSDALRTFGLLVGAVALRANVIGAMRRQTVAERQAETAAADERGRIARELHDVVAHQMTVVVAQAQGAEVLVDSDPRRVRAALQTITTTTRDALIEMRRLVDVQPGIAASPQADVEQPQPGLAYEDYARLAESAQAAGLGHVSFNVDMAGDTPVSAGLALSAYRLIQEAITNAAKHSPGSWISLDIRADEAAIVVSVINGPAARATSDIPGAGRGLVGMRERLAVFGGTLETGPTPDGGWSVVARFPTLEAPSTSE